MQHHAAPASLTPAQASWLPRPVACTVGQLLDAATPYLAAAGCSSARLDAEILLAHLHGRTRTWLCTWPEHLVEPELVRRFAQLIERRAARVPVAYLTARRAFYALELEVSPACLIPRPETELLVEASLGWLTQRAALCLPPRPLRVLDLCTGSGAIAVSIAHARADCEVVATDISAAALGVAARNADAAGVRLRVDMRCGDLLDVLAPDEHFDLITANPPYVSAEEMLSLEPEVREHEPQLALVAAESGFAIVDRILTGCSAHLRPGGALAVEIGASQGARALDRMKHLPYHSVQIKQDASGRDRLVWAHTPA